ncbi:MULTISPECIES: hypothetical protein [unclassified Duganella]|jgi:hypothetical protein|uniref:hypothetical protein n=1 Tax=unclassified Duganella TaxID=2636909 RepID=UPI0008924404|nr:MULTISPECIES: hypothetical protein [unclassified Duganella]SDG05758.1 hypothetical protein SAMN05216320_102507 [Duganella sp. OV458]SDI99666.1 hypothetical protein SAMN05428973_10244 [Duganella sp. OV510]
MNRVSLMMPAPVTRNNRGRAVGMMLALLCALGNLALAMLLPAIWPLSLSLGSVLALAWLIHTQPLVQHVEYFSADEDGLRYVHAPGQDGRVLRYKWTEIISVAAAKGGLRVETGRGAQKGATVFLSMPSEADCQAASQAAAHWLSAYRL